MNGNGEKLPLFSMSINLGSILTILAMIVSVALAYSAIGARITVLELQIKNLPVIETKVDIVNDKLTDLAYREGRQEQKLEDERRDK